MKGVREGARVRNNSVPPCHIDRSTDARRVSEYQLVNLHFFTENAGLSVRSFMVPQRDGGR